MFKKDKQVIVFINPKSNHLKKLIHHLSSFHIVYEITDQKEELDKRSFSCDLKQFEEIENILDEIKGKHKRIDVIISNLIENWTFSLKDCNNIDIKNKIDKNLVLNYFINTNLTTFLKPNNGKLINISFQNNHLKHKGLFTIFSQIQNNYLSFLSHSFKDVFITNVIVNYSSEWYENDLRNFREKKLDFLSQQAMFSTNLKTYEKLINLIEKVIGKKKIKDIYEI